MKKNIIIIAAIIIYSFLIIWLFTFFFSKTTVEANENAEKLIKQTEIKYNQKIDSILLIIKNSEQQRNLSNKKIKILREQIKSIEINKKNIIINFKKKQDEILNTSDSADWIWFNKRFPNTYNNATAIKTDKDIRK